MSDAAVQKERVSAEQVGVVRGVTIAEVLGTDMKKHFDITSRFQVSPTKRFSNKLLQAKLTDPILQTCMTAMQQSLSTQTLDVPAIMWKVKSPMADQLHAFMSVAVVCCAA